MNGRGTPEGDLRIADKWEKFSKKRAREIGWSLYTTLKTICAICAVNAKCPYQPGDMGVAWDLIRYIEQFPQDW